MDFWRKLKQQGPIVGLSPMDGVTDAPFRAMVAKYGRQDSRKQDNSDKSGVDVIFTEFVSTDGLHFARGERKERILREFVRVRELVELEAGKPYEVAQVFGKEPELFAEAAALVESLGFDGLDINMGCPAKKVSQHGAGAALIRTPELAQEILRVAKAATGLPVSVKTRVGVESANEMDEWIEALMEVSPTALSLHGRTLKQLYSGEANWEVIQRAGEIVHKHGGIILGNGDIDSVQSVKLKVQRYGVDGVLVGRASFGNPAFAKATAGEASREQRLAWMVEHARLHEQVFGPEYFLPARKHMAWYAKGFPGASELRQQLVRANSAQEVEEIVQAVMMEG